MGVRKCNRCGKELMEDNIYCTFCGYPYNEMQNQPAENLSNLQVGAWWCEVCREEKLLELGGTYCGKCGSALVMKLVKGWVVRFDRTVAERSPRSGYIHSNKNKL